MSKTTLSTYTTPTEQDLMTFDITPEGAIKWIGDTAVILEPIAMDTEIGTFTQAKYEIVVVTTEEENTITCLGDSLEFTLDLLETKFAN